MGELKFRKQALNRKTGAARFDPSPVPLGVLDRVRDPKAGGRWFASLASSCVR